MNLILALLAAAAKVAFSLKKPYPGWMPSAFDFFAMAIISLMFR